MNDLYNDVDVLGTVMADMLNGNFTSAQKKVQDLLKEKCKILSEFEKHIDEQALAHEDGISEGQGGY